MCWFGQPQLDPKFPHPSRDDSTQQQGSLAARHPATASPGAPATSRVPAGPHPARVPTSLVLIGGYMQTPVVSSFMGRESGGEQREWAQWGLLAGSACSRGEEGRQGGRGGKPGGERREGRERRERQHSARRIWQPRLLSSQHYPWLLSSCC